MVTEDDSLPARELTRPGLRPGEHLRLIPKQRPAMRPRMALHSGVVPRDVNPHGVRGGT